MLELPESVRERFIAAGWSPERRVSVPSIVPTDHPAFPILQELNGLTVTPDETPGEECARNDLSFQSLEPAERITGVWADLLGTQLLGVAEVHYRHGQLYVAADGRCFGCSCVHDAFYFEGGSFAEAVERSLLGRRARPMLRPDQSSVTLYGVRFTAECPEVYRYSSLPD